MTLQEAIQNYTALKKNKGLLRTRVIANNDKQALNFNSNDYLALTGEPRIAAAYQKGYQLYPSGSGGSMLLSGYHEIHHAVERAFAAFLDVDDCILMSSGYAANLAVTSLLGQIRATCLIDKSVHASIYDGLKLADVKYKRFLHNDLNDLNKQLNTSAINPVVITEGIFGMSGQQASLHEMHRIGASQQAVFIVDEAHSIGVLGMQGQGAVALHQLGQHEIPLRIIPLGKAFAGQGALIAGQQLWIDAILQAGRSLIYSTAISPALAYGLLETLTAVREADDRRYKLARLIHYFKQRIDHSPLTWSASTSTIQQLQLGCPHLALFYAAELSARGIHCSAIRPPTVPMQSAGLRIIINAAHREQHIDQLFHQLGVLHERAPG